MQNIKYWIINLFVAFLFLSDLLFKYIFSASGREYFILNNWLGLRFAINDGIAFGIDVNYYFIISFYVIAIPILIWALIKQYKDNNRLNVLALTLVIFGALSNFVDRILFGGVVDYIDLKYYSVFNIADIMIVAGVVIVILSNFGNKKKIEESDKKII